jgi:hypothetical protein
MKELAKALLKVHNEMPQVGNNAVNGHFRSDYCTLDHLIELVKPVFLRNGIIPQEGCFDGKVAMQLLHAESGEVDAMCEIELVCKDPSNPQQQKSAETYARRRLWQLKAGICPAGEDDDANSASTEPKNQPATSPQGKKGLPQKTVEAFGEHGELVLNYLISIGSVPAGGGFEDVSQFRDDIIAKPAKVVKKAQEAKQ